MPKLIKVNPVKYTLTAVDGYPALHCSLSVLGHIVLNRGPKALIKIHRVDYSPT